LANQTSSAQSSSSSGTWTLGAALHRWIIAAAFLAIGSIASAQELSLLAGPLDSAGEHSYSWDISYRTGLGRYAAWSLTWLNEGHIPYHHRDGQALQLWARLPLADDRLELSAGAGPYRFFDTVTSQNLPAYDNAHGWGAVLSLRLAYYFDSRWIGEMKLNRVKTNGGPDTSALLFGVGYQLDAPNGPGPREQPTPRTSDVTGNELTMMIGASILNSDRSESSPAASLEFRHGLGRYLDMSASLLHEDGEVQSRRDGIAAQLWVTNAFFDDRFTLSAGLGPYVALTVKDSSPLDSTGDGRVAGLVSVSASYRFDRKWVARLTWNRFATRYDRDADLIQAGIGVRF